MTPSLPESSACGATTDPLRQDPATDDWMTDRMGFELAVACQMAGIPVRPMGGHKPQAEPAPEPAADVQAVPDLTEVSELSGGETQLPELSDMAKGAREFDQLMRVHHHQLVESMRRKVSAPVELIEGFARALRGKGGSEYATLPVVLLVGPSGCGKTLLARSLLEDDASELGRVIEIDLAQCNHVFSGSIIDGLEPGYSNAAPGVLTSHVFKNPLSLIIFDNPERAHPAVLNRIVRMVATGKMTDRFGLTKGKGAEERVDPGTVVDFSHCRVAFTTQAGCAVYDDPLCLSKAGQDADLMADMVLGAMTQSSTDEGEFHPAPRIPTALAQLLKGKVFVMPRASQGELEAQLRQSLNEAVMEHLSMYSHPQRPWASLELDGPWLERALLLSAAGGASWRDAKHDLPQVVVNELARAMSELPDFPRFVNIEVAPDVSRQMEPLQRQVTGGRTVVEEMLRRRQRLSLRFTHHHDPVRERLVVRLSGVEVRQVVAAADITGPIGVNVQTPQVRFADVAGHSAAKGRLQALARLHALAGSDPEARQAMPRGLLMYGPPGTGKTLLAKALAAEAQGPFIPTVGGDWNHPQRVRDLFAMARRYAPSILFIDELDAIGRRDDQSGSRLIINQMISEIDGFDTRNHLPVLVVGATNDIDRVDPALLRSGRLDIRLKIGALDMDERERLLQTCLLRAGLKGDVPKALLSVTAGCTGADIDRLGRELLCEKLLDRLTEWPLPQLMDVALHVLDGEALPPVDQDMAEHIAFHEAGHAVASRVLQPEQPIAYVSIVRSEGTGGRVRFAKEPGIIQRMTRQRVKTELQVLLAGRVAQELAFGEEGADAGSAADLEQASALAIQAIEAWGMDPDYGLWSVPSGASSLLMSTQGELVIRARAWIKEAADAVRALLKAHWTEVEALAQQLQQERWVEGAPLMVTRSYDR